MNDFVRKKNEKKKNEKKKKDRYLSRETKLYFKLYEMIRIAHTWMANKVLDRARP